MNPMKKLKNIINTDIKLMITTQVNSFTNHPQYRCDNICLPSYLFVLQILWLTIILINKKLTPPTL